MSIYKDCDVRGIVGRELTSKDVYKIGRALAEMCGGEILVGGDARVSTPELKAALVSGLLDSGTSVCDLGTIPTPVLYFAMKHLKCQAGATVTASHNPPEYNGVKFMIGETPVTRATIDALKKRVETGDYPEKQGKLTQYNAAEVYADALVKRFEGAEPLRVLVDAGNGAMSTIAPDVFRSAGYDVVELNCVEDGRFPNRDPNPSDYRNLAKTCTAVQEAKVDFAVAFDGDGDRAVFIDHTGTPVQNEKSLVLFVRALLQNKATPVVFDQKASSVVRDAILEMGGTPLPEKSGHAFIKKRFLENGAALGGEVSGHFFFGELGYDDGLFAGLFMGEIIAKSGRTLKAMTDEIVCPPITPDLRVATAYADQDERLKQFETAALENGAQEISRLDGVRAAFADGWVLLRKSVTAEQITVRAEARSAERLHELIELAARVFPEQERAALLSAAGI